MNSKFTLDELKQYARKPVAELCPESLRFIILELCTNCKKEITDFRNIISIKEYKISGLCQKCQDFIYGVD